MCRCLSACWKASVPHRTKAFGWRCVIDSLPLKILFDSRCVLCLAGDEDGYHLLKVCLFSKQMWTGICSWLGLEVDLVGSVTDGLSSWVRDCRKMGINKDTACGIWMTVL